MNNNTINSPKQSGTNKSTKKSVSSDNSNSDITTTTTSETTHSKIVTQDIASSSNNNSNKTLLESSNTGTKDINSKNSMNDYTTTTPATNTNNNSFASSITPNVGPNLNNFLSVADSFPVTPNNLSSTTPVALSYFPSIPVGPSVPTFATSTISTNSHINPNPRRTDDFASVSFHVETSDKSQNGSSQSVTTKTRSRPPSFGKFKIKPSVTVNDELLSSLDTEALKYKDVFDDDDDDEDDDQNDGGTRYESSAAASFNENHIPLSVQPKRNGKRKLSDDTINNTTGILKSSQSSQSSQSSKKKSQSSGSKTDATVKSEDNHTSLMDNQPKSESITRPNSASDSNSPKVQTDKSGTNKTRKKKKIFSCDECRKGKTKCDPEPNGCRRCTRLRLECSNKDINSNIMSLANSVAGANSGDTESSNSMSSTSLANLEIENRLKSLESVISGFDTKFNKLISAISGNNNNHNNSSQFHQNSPSNGNGGSNGASPIFNHSYSNNLKPLFDSNQGDNLIGYNNTLLPICESIAPLSIIKDIDSKLFQRVNKYDPFKQACDEFLDFYFQHEELCLNLAKSFLDISHFWIIPGGITEIDRNYVNSHPFITCVFVVLAMCFDENFNYVEEQKILFSLTTKLMGIALITEPLTDHDIEAILYISLYNIARKPKQQEFDNWLLSGHAIKHSMLSFDIKNIKHRVQNLKIYNDEDFYHLRIINALCSSHFQNAIGTGKPIMINQSYFDVHNLTILFPNTTVGDAIKVAELDLYYLLSKKLNSYSYFQSSNNIQFGDDILIFRDIDEWKNKWEKVIDADASGMLTFAYNFSITLLSRTYIKLVQQSPKSVLTNKNLAKAANTCCQFSFETLEKFAGLEVKLIRGCPKFQLAQIIFSCINLLDFLEVMKPNEKQMSLSKISKVYWHLNSIGEKKNDATDTVGRIIRSLTEKFDHLNNMNYSSSSSSGAHDNQIASLTPSDNLYSRPLDSIIPTGYGMTGTQNNISYHHNINNNRNNNNNNNNISSGINNDNISNRSTPQNERSGSCSSEQKRQSLYSIHNSPADFYPINNEANTPFRINQSASTSNMRSTSNYNNNNNNVNNGNQKIHDFVPNTTTTTPTTSLFARQPGTSMGGSVSLPMSINMPDALPPFGDRQGSSHYSSPVNDGIELPDTENYENFENFFSEIIRSITKYNPK
ncbi:hypothetical protein B5S31_g1301 [[Candida] boidinii]|nr:hypothetical protein B5S31_g1301 [[Candida] boidinii]